MNELLSFFQFYLVNQAFLATIFLITLNNIWRKIDVKIPLQVIRYVLIAFGTLNLINFCYSLFWETEGKEVMLYFYNRSSGPMKDQYLFTIGCSVILPFTLLIERLGTKKYFILLVSFFIVSGMWFERFVIIVTSLYRGHIPASWAYYYPTWVELPFFIIKMVLFLSPFLLVVANIMVFLKRRFKKQP